MTLQIHSIRTKVKTPLAKRIAHALTDRKILQFRFDAHLRNQVWQRLSKTQKALLNRINAAGIDALPKRELDKLLKELKAEIAKNYQETTAYIQPELSGFFAVEKQALTELYNDEIGYDFFNQVPSYQRKATQQATIIAGMPLESWFEKQGTELSFKFESTIRQGLLEGRQTPEIAKATAELFGISRRHADTLVITAVAKVADDAHKALRDENLDLIKGEMHLSTLDTRTSTVCQVRDGKMWDTDYKPIGHSLPYQRPPLHPRCRSILQLVMKDWKELGFDDVKETPKSTRASADGQVSEKTNYEEWLSSKTPEEQDKALGKGKADLWRRGVITFSDMLDQSARPLTLKELYSLKNSSSVDKMDSVELVRKKAVAVEPMITRDVVSIITASGGEPAGLDFRLKSLSSLQRKIDTEIMAGVSKEQAIASIRDVIRYTAILDEQRFVEQYQKMQKDLEKQGYSTIIVKNTWKSNNAYKGINTFVSTFIEKNNIIFELQYHTKQSFELKNGKLHELYEKFRDLNIPLAKKSEILLEMQKLSANLKEPKNIDLIKEKK
ncbi:TPA: phage head morphogenesis protein [Mannheimia haemolytica]|uniref:phage minor head protein n=1 Tax=Mannheimia haemolytica TaxID=75985 RepID=UPI00094B2ED5|nr:phage minor head protein [Mannheimia haemolytica]MDW0536087.1 phage minor head protein [Mannheimia haemolytica]MDW0538701.1 phage minor head protein [Mannheimia haemolytica]MDW0625910.1 phage minor head protein [Mannheimia haemolytica]MDW1158463.1 phage minor head protein [Mannheimia haemolytica]QEA91913.1 phage head morphogenesis protein [Mannheimia haemolytica]